MFLQYCTKILPKTLLFILTSQYTISTELFQIHVRMSFALNLRFGFYMFLTSLLALSAVRKKTLRSTPKQTDVSLNVHVIF